MLEDWWDTEEYRKRFVPYYTMRVALLYEWCMTCPHENTVLLHRLIRSWHDLGDALDREYQFRTENGYPTDEIETAISCYTDCSSVLAERLNDSSKGLVSAAEPPLSG